MKAWIISVTGMSLIFFVLKIIMPEKRMSKTVILVYSLISVVNLVSPLANGIISDAGAARSVYSYTQSAGVDANYMRKYYEISVRDVLKGEKIVLNKADVVLSDDNFSLKKISINYSDLGYDGDERHIDIASLTKKTVAEYFSIPETMVVIYGENSI